MSWREFWDVILIYGLNKDKIIVKVRGSTNSISNINSFYYSTRNHTQRRFQSDYKLLTWLHYLSYSNNANNCKCCQVFIIITYVHSSGGAM
jgi:hypothetical protein